MIKTIWAVLTSSSAARVALGLALLAAVLLALVRWLDRTQEAAVTQAVEAGRAEHRADDQAAILNQVEKAKNAQETIRRDDAAAHALCVRYSRTPENC